MKLDRRGKLTTFKRSEGTLITNATSRGNFALLHKLKEFS